MKKISIIGAGYVGSTIAYSLSLRSISDDIVLIDIDRNKAQGEVDDIRHGLVGMGDSFVRTGSYSDCDGSDLIIITAGRNRKPNESRLDMIHDNIGIMKNVCENLLHNYNGGIVIIVSNPVDILTYYGKKWLSLPDGKVFGTGCILDTSRFVRAIADHAKCPISNVYGIVIGEHGDSQLPVWSNLTVSGMTIEKHCLLNGLNWNNELKDQIQNKVKKLGAQIIAAKGRTHYGIATCVCMLANSVLNNEPVTASVTSVLNGEYGLYDVSLSLPCIIGSDGISERKTLSLSDHEISDLKNSAEKLKLTIADSF